MADLYLHIVNPQHLQRVKGRVSLCATCQAPTIGQRVRKFCSNRCKKAAQRKRAREKPDGR